MSAKSALETRGGLIFRAIVWKNVEKYLNDAIVMHSKGGRLPVQLKAEQYALPVREGGVQASERGQGGSGKKMQRF